VLHVVGHHGDRGASFRSDASLMMPPFVGMTD
jgi:hypothetical protein